MDRKGPHEELNFLPSESSSRAITGLSFSAADRVFPVQRLQPAGIRHSLGLSAAGVIVDVAPEEAPVPVMLMICVDPLTRPVLSVMVTVAVKVPAEAGLKATLRTQLEPAPRELPHGLERV
jgi:hypothetical protein